MDSRAAQRALFDAALDASGDEQLVLLDRVAESVRNFGDHSDPRHVEAVLDLITSSGGQTAEAAARVAGSLNLPTSTSIELIP
jgi:hypothetical protein